MIAALVVRWLMSGIDGPIIGMILGILEGSMLLSESCVGRLILDGGTSVLISEDFSEDVDRSGAIDGGDTLSFDSELSICDFSSFEGFSEVTSRVIGGDFDDEYSATSMLGEGKISFILTSVMTGISDTGVISLIVISGILGSLGGNGAMLVSASPIEDTLETDELPPGNGVPSENEICTMYIQCYTYKCLKNTYYF